MSYFCAYPSPALLPNVRVIPPQPFAPSGKGRLARVPQAAPCGHFASLVRSIATQSARLPSESFAFCGASAGAESRAVGAGAFGRSGGVRACRRVSRPACGGPRIRRMRDIPPRRNTAFAACPRPGGADGRPAVREPLGRASAPVPPLRAISPCVSVLYDAAARRLHLPCRPASVRILRGIKALVLAGEGEDFIRTVIS